MNRLQKEVITFYRTQLVNIVDPNTTACTLLKQGDIDKTICEKLQAEIRKGSSREELWKTLLPDVLSNCSFGSFWSAIYKSGYEMLSTKLLIKFWQCQFNTRVVTDLPPAESATQINFFNLKASFHDQAFKEPHETLLEKSNNLKKKYEEASGDEKRQFADRYAAYLCVLIDTKAMEFIGRFPNHNMFDSLKALITETSNIPLTEVAYYSRLAIAHGMANEMEPGRDCMAKAHMAAFKVEQTVQYVYNMLYIHIHFFCMQVEYPTSNDICEILDQTKLLCQSLPANDDGAVFWKKMLVLRVACFLLGISHKGVVNELHKVERQHVDDAKKFLTEIDAHWNGIEYIRKLFYFVCRARIQEIELQESFEYEEGDRQQQERAILSLEIAVENLDDTIGEDKECCFLEIPFAKAYSHRLRAIIRDRKN